MEAGWTWVDLDEARRDRLVRGLGALAEPRPPSEVPPLADLGRRRWIAELFEPGPGHRLDAVVGCAPDSDSALRLSAALAAVDPSLAGDPRRVAWFAGGEGRSELPTLHRVQAPLGGRFQPNIWAIRLVGRRGVRLRVVVAAGVPSPACPSCLALVSEAMPSPSRRILASRAFADLLLCLPGLSSERWPGFLGELLGSLADQVDRARLPAPEGAFGAVELLVSGLERGPHPWLERQPASGVLALAREVGAAGLGPLAALPARRRVLIAGAEALRALPASALGRWQERRQLDPELGGVVGGGSLVAVERGRSVRWWLGSPDLAADPGSGVDLDLVARVRGCKGRVGGRAGQGVGRFLRVGFGASCHPLRATPPGGEPGPPPGATSSP